MQQKRASLCIIYGIALHVGGRQGAGRDRELFKQTKMDKLKMDKDEGTARFSSGQERPSFDGFSNPSPNALPGVCSIFWIDVILNRERTRYSVLGREIW